MLISVISPTVQNLAIFPPLTFVTVSYDQNTNVFTRCLNIWIHSSSTDSQNQKKKSFSVMFLDLICELFMYVRQLTKNSIFSTQPAPSNQKRALKIHTGRNTRATQHVTVRQLLLSTVYLAKHTRYIYKRRTIRAAWIQLQGNTAQRKNQSIQTEISKHTEL